VSFVIEKNDEVQPVLPSELAPSPTPVAKVDPERLKISLETAEADRQVAERRLEANRVAIEQRIPAAVESADSELKFAEAEFRRATRLKKQSVIPESEYDAARNRLNVTKSALASVKAELAQARAEQAALESQVRRANQSIEEARRNLRNTTLFSSFRGIVSEVHAVPGSFVNPGDPVATVQMMDPMLVQFEVSPRDSRKYAKGDILDVIVTDSSGNRQISNGMVYTVDAVADSDSRTYTVTLHIRNRKESHAGNHPLQNVARTRRVFSLDLAPVITGGQQQLIEQNCLHKIGDDTVVFKITNRKANQASDPGDRVLMVEPVKVEAGTAEITLLGQWKFVPVHFVDPSAIDLDNDLVTGKLSFPDQTATVNSLQGQADPWGPQAVVLEQPRWALRAGDVVQVVKSGGSFQQGYFIPMKAVLNDNGKTFLHVVEHDDKGETVARRIEVDVQNQSSLSDDTIRVQVLPKVAGKLTDGMQVVIGGSHYLSEGARVKVVQGASR
jgi:multidrug efflux pump subunit AcrA (membrane-fusion protein)